jgi:hypothetical protein
MKAFKTKFSYIFLIITALYSFLISCEKNEIINNPTIIDTTLATRDFAPLNAKWYFSQSFAWNDNTEYLTIESTGDTIIQGKNCKVLEKKGELSCTYYNEKDFVYREKGIVYFYSPLTNNFQILYNHNAQKDSFWTNVFSISFPFTTSNLIDTVQVTVDSVSNILVNDFDLKTYYVTYRSLNKNYENWRYQGLIIEKIGDVSFLFNFQEAGTFCEINEKGLKCYEDDQLGRFFIGADSCNLNDWEIL